MTHSTHRRDITRDFLLLTPQHHASRLPPPHGAPGNRTRLCNVSLEDGPTTALMNGEQHGWVLEGGGWVRGLEEGYHPRGGPMGGGGGVCLLLGLEPATLCGWR